MRASPWAALAIVLAFAAVAAATLDTPSPLRPVLVASFLFVAPGLPWIELLALNDRVARLSLTVALSLALDILVTGALFYAGVWSWQLAIAILAGMCMSGTYVAISFRAEQATGRARQP